MIRTGFFGSTTRSIATATVVTASSTGPSSVEAAVAWKIFQLNWLLLATMLGVLDLALVATDFRVQPAGYLMAIGFAAAYGACGYYNAGSSRPQPWIFSMLTGVAQIILVIVVMISLTYIAAAADFSLQDARLLAFDRAIGFDFRAFVGFVNDRDWLIAILVF